MDSGDLLICAIFLLSVYLYRRFKNLYSFFDRNDVPVVEPVPFFGNAKDWILMRKPLAMIYYQVYRGLESHRFGGMYIGMSKNVLIRDPELIRNILVKDFLYFQDRQGESNRSDLLGKSLLLMRGEEWKNLRIKLTSTFTSGKMKLMFPRVQECGTKLHAVLETVSKSGTDFDVKDICSRFTIDVIGSCVFGLETNSLQDPDSVFRKMGTKIFEVSFAQILGLLFPKFYDFFAQFGNDQEITEFFTNLVRKAVEYRELHKISRGDFLDLLIALKHDTDTQKSDEQQDREDLEKFIDQTGGKQNKSNVEMTVELMTAQCFLFFGAGFETSSSTLSYMLLELAQNQHIQDKLRKEIISVLENNHDQLTYEALKQMKYLDMVIDETLRKYPTTGRIIRVCGKPYQIPDSTFTIPTGTTVIVSLRGLHYDTKYYENPNEFYPEHFTEEAKAKRPHYTYLPFGDGPRSCIGERFGKMQIKVGAVNLLREFSYQLSPKLRLPVEHTSGITLTNMKGGIWLKCSKL